MINRTIVINIAILTLVAISAILLVLIPPLPPSHSNIDRSFQEKLWPERMGVQTNKFDPLLAKIKADIKWEDVEIRVLVGPYFRRFGTVGMLVDDYYPRYFILLDEEFYNELTPEEQEAGVAHEAGHILFRPFLEMGRSEVTEVQAMVDNFAAKYVHPKHLSSLLDKAYADYLVRKRRLEELALSR